jgi:hypothetical protein
MGLSIGLRIDDPLMQRDWRDDRIAELEAEVAAKDACIAELRFSCSVHSIRSHSSSPFDQNTREHRVERRA